MVKKRLIGKNIIGIDELNNGFHIQRKDFPMVICGYLIEDFPSSYPERKYVRKNGIFGEKSDSVKEILGRARPYFNENPDFFYTLIQKENLENKPLYKRAEAIAAIVFRFFIDYGLSEENTLVIADWVGRDGFSKDICFFCNESFKIAGLDKLIIRFEKKADVHNYAVKAADRAAYYIGGLKYKSNWEKWPYSGRKVDMGELPELIMKLKDQNP
ncbi:MAG: hypothetical protein Q7J54_06675 [Candidatus Woesearchaeota archaeon]|nr:hypothetical protein [Candidatus Woesearchaeota archaeon]